MILQATPNRLRAMLVSLPAFLSADSMPHEEQRLLRAVRQHITHLRKNHSRWSDQELNALTRWLRQWENK